MRYAPHLATLLPGCMPYQNTVAAQSLTSGGKADETCRLCTHEYVMTNKCLIAHVGSVYPCTQSLVCHPCHLMSLTAQAVLKHYFCAAFLLSKLHKKLHQMRHQASQHSRSSTTQVVKPVNPLLTLWQCSGHCKQQAACLGHSSSAIDDLHPYPEDLPPEYGPLWTWFEVLSGAAT